MSRSGYYEMDDSDGAALAHGRWRAQVASAIRGKRGQKFLQELAVAMDAMIEKKLISKALVTPEGDCCTIGVVCKARGLDVSNVDEYFSEEVGDFVGIAQQLAAEIAYENDECDYNLEQNRTETPEEKWVRMRAWVEEKLKK